MSPNRKMANRVSAAAMPLPYKSLSGLTLECVG
jgi:hypothetical protein